MNLKLKKTEKGFSLLELLLVVAVGAILILAGLAIYRNITQNTDVNEASRMINVLKQETQRLFQGEPDYSALTNTILTNAGVVPAQYTNGVGIINSPFSNSAVTFASAGTNNENFTLEIVGVPTEACTKLGLEYNANDGDFVDLDIGGTSTDAPDLTFVDTNCAGDPTMIWTFN